MTSKTVSGVSYMVSCNVCIDGDFYFTAIKDIERIWCPYCGTPASLTKVEALPFDEKNCGNIGNSQGVKQ